MNVIKTVGSAGKGSRHSLILNMYINTYIQTRPLSVTRGFKLNKLGVNKYRPFYPLCRVCASAVVIGWKAGNELSGCHTSLETNVPLILPIAV